MRLHVGPVSSDVPPLWVLFAGDQDRVCDWSVVVGVALSILFELSDKVFLPELWLRFLLICSGLES